MHSSPFLLVTHFVCPEKRFGLENFMTDRCRTVYFMEEHFTKPSLIIFKKTIRLQAEEGTVPPVSLLR